MYNRKLNKNYLSTILRLYENLKPKSLMPLFPDSGSLFCTVFMYSTMIGIMVLKQFLFIENCFNYNVVPMWFSRNQLPPSMAKISFTDFKKIASLQRNQNQASSEI